jgi:hypothetical protein
MAFSSSQANRYSYSGSDVDAFAYFQKNKMVKLDSMHTVSLSVFEAKGRVRSLGFKSVRGFTRAVREIAGSLIMMVVEDHPLANLMDINPYYGSKLYGNQSKSSWSLDAKNTALGAEVTDDAIGGLAGFPDAAKSKRRIPTTLPPFNIALLYNSESTSSPSWQKTKDENHGTAVLIIEDIEIVGEGIVTSVNDMVTEVQYQFIARDFKELTLNIPIDMKSANGDRAMKMVQKSDELKDKEIIQNAGGDATKNGEFTLTIGTGGQNLTPRQKRRLNRAFKKIPQDNEELKSLSKQLADLYGFKTE